MIDADTNHALSHGAGSRPGPLALAGFAALACSLMGIGGCLGSGGSGSGGSGGTMAAPGSGGSSTSAAGPDVTGLLGTSPEHQAFLDDNADSVSASGSWSQDGDTLSFEFGESGFACDGPGAGDAGEFTIVELTADRLVLDMMGDVMEFERLGEGEGIVGSWYMEAGDLVLTFTEDGDLIASGASQDCSAGDNGGGGSGDGDGYYTDDGCYISSLPRGTEIAVDGRLGDWQTEGVTVVQDMDDQDGDIAATGADISGIRVAAGADNLFILLETHDPLNTNFQGGSGETAGSYVVSISHDGNGTYIMTLVYDTAAGQWIVRGDSGSVEVSNADRALEMRVSWSTLGNPSQIYQVQVASQDCSEGPCVMWDEGPCFGEAN